MVRRKGATTQKLNFPSLLFFSLPFFMNLWSIQVKQQGTELKGERE